MNFKYINESPLKTNNSLEFGHKEIVSSLKLIIEKQSWNITIGLFGNWGTGKSSIVEGLKDELQHKQIPLVLFDVWKHEGDALRRTFIKECRDQLSAQPYGESYISKPIKIDDRVTSEKTISQEIFDIKWAKLFKSLGIAILIIVAVFMAAVIINGILLLFSVNLLDKINASTTISFATAVVSASLIAQFLELFIKTEKTDVKENKFQDPHEFEQEFGRIVQHLNNPGKKIVITFDNLDRVSGENALNIISTIKTFLDYKCKKDETSSVIFLIPCDVDSMKRHISDSMKSKAGDQENSYIDEFLRKFFNTSIWIPDFYSTDLENFATTKLTETAIPEFQNDYLSWLIIKVFNKNPRQIIQFINHMVSNYILLKEICDKNGLETDFYKHNIPQLAKFLLIKQRHAECLDLYRRESIYNLDNPEILLQINDENFKALLVQTEDISIPSLEPYFKGRITQEEQNFPGIVKLLEMMKFDAGDPVEYARSLDLEENTKAFDTILKLEFLKIKNPLQKTTFLNHLLELCANYDITLTNGFYREIINFILSTDIEDIFNLINPKHLRQQIFEKTESVTKTDKGKIVSGFLAIICSKENPKNSVIGNQPFEGNDKILKFLTSNKELFSKQQQSYFQNYVEQNPLQFNLKNYFFIDQETQDFFISEKVIAHFLKAFNPHQPHELLHYQMVLVNNFIPKSNYTESILTVYNDFWTRIFDPQQNQSESFYQTELEFLEILCERIEQTIVVGNKINPDLIQKINNHLLNLDSKQLEPWLIIIHRLLGLDASKEYMIKLINGILLSNDTETLEKLYAFFPDRNDIINLSTQIADQYVSNLIKLPFECENFQNLTNDAIIIAIKKFVGQSDYNEAKELVNRHRDKFEEIQINTLFDFLTNNATGNIEAGVPEDYIKEVCEMVLTLADLNPTVLEGSGFWTIMIDMLQNTEFHPYSELAFKFIKENLRLLSFEMSEGIFNSLIQRMDSHGIYNNPHFHESIYLLLKEKLNRPHAEIYVDRILLHILPNSKNHNVLLLAASALGDLGFEINDFVLQLEEFLNWTYLHNGDSSIRGIIPAKQALLKLLKRKRSKEFEVIKKKLEDITADE
ncbi:hypothetical protein FBD94_06885 [Pedobacter hiemivivus]|uniref:KAP NTPase domain-containing protein n=1 Tax=Pedobacter hiemivivus TaxID=2530454 RepID=A0A4U1GM11_9SPHI|nr:P-loop NTPase fold protein [Pedobacter hiemivivus]TKC64060.1 hypothetical protein FBD94_06885 [Pedobacter hiemivivus]